MRYRRGAQLDTSQIEDRRGRGGMLGLPGGRLTVGGGSLGVVGVLVYLLVSLLSGGGGLTGPLANLDGSTVSEQPPGQALGQECQTGADATREDCRIVAYVNSIQALLDERVPRRRPHYAPATTVFFTGQTHTGCGTASTDGRPVLLPGRQARLHRPRLLRRAAHAASARKAGRSPRPMSSPTSTATTSRTCSAPLERRVQRAGRGERSVRTELQADCFAGVWASHATQTGIIEPLTQADIADALNAAAAVGDDRIQSEAQGQVDPETWTHGSSAQRNHWFGIGYETGRRASCDTFGGRI